jgi:deoxyhypusine synthase
MAITSRAVVALAQAQMDLIRLDERLRDLVHEVAREPSTDDQARVRELIRGLSENIGFALRRVEEAHEAQSSEAEEKS